VILLVIIPYLFKLKIHTLQIRSACHVQSLHCTITSIYVIIDVMGVRLQLGIHTVHSATTLNKNSVSVFYNTLATNRSLGTVVSIVTRLQGRMTQELWFNSWQFPFFAQNLVGSGAHTTSCSVGIGVKATWA
jgi:hypothetical protein